MHSRLIMEIITGIIVDTDIRVIMNRRVRKCVT